MTFFKKKHTLKSPVFGELTYSDSEYVGDVFFEPTQKTIDVYFSSSDKDFRDEYIEIWNKLLKTYSRIISLSLDAINEDEDEYDFYEAEISQENLDSNNLSLEGVSFEQNLTVKLLWGVIAQNNDETSIQVVTSFNYMTENVDFMGGGD